MLRRREIAAEATAHIAAPIELVWRVMLDLPAYAAWNPFIVAVRDAPAELRPGGRFTLVVRWSDGGETRSREFVTRVAPPDPAAGEDARAVFSYRFDGRTHALGLMRAAREQALTRRGAGCAYFTREQFRGALAWAVPLARVQDGFERHARALKARCEALAGGG
jgi:uncharacterized protein YndB with AHSA1/START domain